MKILVDSYNCVTQNISGGVQVKVKRIIEHCSNYVEKIKLFDKWDDKITDYDLLHLFKVDPENYNLMINAKRQHVPVVLSAIVGLEFRCRIFFNKLICKIFPIRTTYWFINQMLIKADAIIAETKKEADFINRIYNIPMNKIYIIPNGPSVELDSKYKDEFSKQTGIKGKFVLQVGRFDQNKNQINVIKAMANTNIPVVFIGGADPGQPNYYEECKKIATPNMHFLGWIKHNNPLLSSAYQNAHVVILPSHKEIFGNSLIEGGSAGANLVATKELPIEDWGISQICRCINPNDLSDIRSKIIAAFNEDLNPNTSKIINDKFCWNKVADMHLKIYNLVTKIT